MNRIGAARKLTVGSTIAVPNANAIVANKLKAQSSPVSSEALGFASRLGVLRKEPFVLHTVGGNAPSGSFGVRNGCGRQTRRPLA